MQELITIQVGQCGNQVAHEFWKRVCLEHGIKTDGTLDNTNNLFNNHSAFFYQTKNDRYVPRAILFDFEPRVRPLFLRFRCVLYTLGY